MTDKDGREEYKDCWRKIEVSQRLHNLRYYSLN